MPQVRAEVHAANVGRRNRRPRRQGPRIGLPVSNAPYTPLPEYGRGRKQPSPPAPRPSTGRGESRRLELPAKIGPYQIKRLLGAGAMGHVYLAHDPHLDRDVAVKVLPRELTADEERVSRFLREARLTAKVQHPNTVVIHQVMVEEGLASIVMELRGRRLAGRDRRKAAARCRGGRRPGRFATPRPAWAPPTRWAWCIATSSRPT